VTHSAWWLTVDTLATYRLAILLTKDTIMLWWRGLLERPLRVQQKRDPEAGLRLPSGWRWYLVELSTCMWCVSIWLAVAVVVLTRFYPAEWQYVGMVLALSAVAGFLGEH
jgi:Protein of unknown function (DUF1360)